MNRYQFKTNINCTGCVAKVTPVLNGSIEIDHWHVDTADPAKLLTVETSKLSAEEVKQLVSRAGFVAEFRTN